MPLTHQRSFFDAVFESNSNSPLRQDSAEVFVALAIYPDTCSLEENSNDDAR